MDKNEIDTIRSLVTLAEKAAKIVAKYDEEAMKEKKSTETDNVVEDGKASKKTETDIIDISLEEYEENDDENDDETYVESTNKKTKKKNSKCKDISNKKPAITLSKKKEAMCIELPKKNSKNRSNNNNLELVEEKNGKNCEITDKSINAKTNTIKMHTSHENNFKTDNVIIIQKEKLQKIKNEKETKDAISDKTSECINENTNDAGDITIDHSKTEEIHESTDKNLENLAFTKKRTEDVSLCDRNFDEKRFNSNYYISKKELSNESLANRPNKNMMKLEFYSKHIDKYDPIDVVRTLRAYEISFQYIEFGYQNKTNRIIFEFYVGVDCNPDDYIRKHTVLHSELYEKRGYCLSRFIPDYNYLKYRGYGTCLNNDSKRYLVDGFDDGKDFDVLDFQEFLSKFTVKPTISAFQIFFSNGFFDGYITFNSTEFLENSNFKSMLPLKYENRLLSLREIKPQKDNSAEYFHQSLRNNKRK